MAAKRIYGCILFLAIIVLTGNQQCQAARNLIQSLSPSLQLQQQKIHFVLVHGACHGAWCWYKLQTLLESAGHRVTAIDLAASGINMVSIDDLRTYINYTQPLLDLMESIPEGEKVVLVGHSMGGYDLAFSMEQYPQKISFAVFLTAILPDIADEPSCAPPELGEWYGMLGGMLDNQIAPFGRPEDNLTSLLFGPRALAQNLYQLSPPEDLTLAKSLVRPAPIFGAYLANRRLFSNEKFGSVKRAFIICKQDRAIREEFQRWMIENTGVAIVKEIEDADHMAMISKPEKVYQYLLEIAEAFSEKLMSSF